MKVKSVFFMGKMFWPTQYFLLIIASKITMGNSTSNGTSIENKKELMFSLTYGKKWLKNVSNTNLYEKEEREGTNQCKRVEGVYMVGNARMELPLIIIVNQMRIEIFFPGGSTLNFLISFISVTTS